MSQPSVTFSSLEAEQVYLLPSTAPEFAQALHPDRAKEFDVLLPYMPLIKNDSDKAIIAYSVRWICTDAAGKTRFPEVNVFDFRMPRIRNVLAAHSSQLVSTVGGLGSHYLRWRQAQTDAESLLALFQKQLSVVIVLEAVVFEDGSAVGPDDNHWIPRWKANLDAERDVYADVNQSSPDELRTALGKLAGWAFDLASMFVNPHTESIHLYLATRHATTYEDCYVLMRGYYANEFLARIAENGEETTIQAVQEVLRSRKYPSVKRKEF